MEMKTITYFGYGSLVNASTVPDNAEIVPGRLQGWIREWRVCGVWENGQGRCALSVRQVPGAEIWGVMTREQQTRMDALNKRESRYEQISRIAGSFRCEAERKPGPDDLFLFKATPENERWGCEQHPILQSYLDCVLAGYHQIWGRDGVDHFFETTDGWHVPILADRKSPMYPRSVEIEPSLLRLFDEYSDKKELRILKD